MNLSSILHDMMPFLQTYSLLMIFLGIFFEGEATLLIAGILCQQGVLAPREIFIVVTIAAFLSDHSWFYLGRRYGQTLLNQFPFLLKHQNRIQPWIQNKSDFIAFGGRFIYGTRILGYMLLGLHHYSVKRFMMIDCFVVTSWSVLGIALGYFLGTSAEAIFGEIKHIEKLFLILIILGFIWHWFKYKKKNTHQLQQEDE